VRGAVRGAATREARGGAARGVAATAAWAQRASSIVGRGVQGGAKRTDFQLAGEPVGERDNAALAAVALCHAIYSGGTRGGREESREAILSISISISLANSFVNLRNGPIGDSIEERKREGNGNRHYYSVVVIIYKSREYAITFHVILLLHYLHLHSDNLYYYYIY
jgi:hypothetical protein